MIDRARESRNPKKVIRVTLMESYGEIGRVPVNLFKTNNGSVLIGECCRYGLYLRLEEVFRGVSGFGSLPVSDRLGRDARHGRETAAPSCGKACRRAEHGISRRFRYFTTVRRDTGYPARQSSSASR